MQFATFLKQNTGQNQTSVLVQANKVANISAVVVVAACFESLEHTSCTGHLQAFAVSDSIERILLCTRDHQNEILRQKHI